MTTAWIWQSDDHDYPVELTGERHVADDGTVYIGVQWEGSATFVPESKLRQQPEGSGASNGRDNNDGHRSRRAERALQKAGITAKPPDASFTVMDTLLDERDIPKRPWIVPGYLLRGGVTVLFGPPDQGKSLTLIAWAVALTLGRSCGRFRPHSPQRVMMIMAEEDNEEQASRFAAALRHAGTPRHDIEPRLRRLVVRDIATLLTVDADNGEVVPTPAWEELRGHIEDFRPDVLMLDPLVELHTADENSNVQAKAVISHFRSLAREFEMAVLLSHHARKGSMTPGDLEALRGASAVGGAVRFAFTAVQMDTDTADTFCIPRDKRGFYLRLDRARGSVAPPAAEAEWFEKLGYTLDNGDQTPALVPWRPPEARPPDQFDLARLLTAIAGGCPAANGEPWSPQLRDNAARSLRRLLRQHGIGRLSESSTIQALHASGVTEVRYRNGDRNWRLGMRSADGLPAASWEHADGCIADPPQ